MTLTRNNIEEIIKKSLEKSKSEKNQYMLFGRILIFINDAFISPDVEFDNVIDYIESNIPAHMFGEVDMILIGDNSYLDERELEAAYREGAILIRNTLPNNKDYIENIVHEMAHATEYQYGMFLYGDYELEQEFTGKRNKFYYLAKAEGYNVDKAAFEDPEYSQEFDDFLYKEVGYEKLNNMLMGLFVSPYASTSLQEYYANGIENYFLDDKKYLSKVSPILYSKILKVVTGG
tara:strand:- start:636 stop:1334 length:699 start_codon:yes stop_codon:yes gene_type:complete